MTDEKLEENPIEALQKQIVDMEQRIAHMIASKKEDMHFVSKAQLLERLGMSKETYYKVTNKNNEQYDPDFPKPVNLFTGNKLRFSSVDVDNYILKYSHSVKAA